MSAVYYNDNDPFACAWLRELMKAGLIPQGIVDERSITDIEPDELAGYDQCHFFAGIGGWPYAIQLAGWSGPVWTGSCPCQPFSAAGRREGTKDERHLWPEFLRLISACRPPVVFGEQVASSEVIGSQLEAAFLVAVQAGDYARANKLAKRLAQSRGFHYPARWVDGVQADVAAIGYAFGFKILGAHSVGAPHIRQRLYWVAYTRGGNGRQADGFVQSDNMAERRWKSAPTEFGAGGAICGGSGLADPDGSGCNRAGLCLPERQSRQAVPDFAWTGGNGGLAHTCSRTCERRAGGLPAPQAGIRGTGSQHGDLPDGLADGGEDCRLDNAGSHGTIPGHPESPQPGSNGQKDGVFGQTSSGPCGLADAQRPEPGLRITGEQGRTTEQRRDRPANDGEPCRLEHPSGDGRQQGRAESDRGSVAARCQSGGLGNPTGSGLETCGQLAGSRKDARPQFGAAGTDGFWSDSLLIPCRDGKARRVKPGICCLADGIQSRVGRLRGYGNAIVPQVAATFIEAFMEIQK